jgi:GNAT superfamily N-acetyltransferase
VAERFTAGDISFKEMSEEEAVKTFQEDGYFDYAKRAARYKTLPTESVWARSPATMFVAFYNETPVGVIGFAPYGKYLLGAGVHVRKEYRRRGLTPLLIDEMLRHKGGKKILVNIANKNIANTYRSAGFKDMDIGTLPAEVKEGAVIGREAGFEQVEKFMFHESGWFEILR